MNRELLEQPFSLAQIKQRPGTFGNQLNYIEGHDVIKRLNDAFEGSWSFRIISHEIYEGEIVVLGELEAESVTKIQFGSSFITKAKDTGTVVSLGDDFKAAATDALKKAASLFGVALHLYGSDNPSTKSVTVSQNRREDSNNKYSGTNHTSTNGQSTTHDDIAPANTNPPNNSNGRISSKQHSYLISLAQDRGLSKQDLNRQSLEHYGSALAYLSKHQASEMIKSMQH